MVFQVIWVLSIDVDGNDYWIWDAIQCCGPIVICEYNSFGCDFPLTIPYSDDFVRDKAHYSIYYGASILSLCQLADSKGYSLVAGNQAANNLFRQV